MTFLEEWLKEKMKKRRIVESLKIAFGAALLGAGVVMGSQSSALWMTALAGFLVGGSYGWAWAWLRHSNQNG